MLENATATTAKKQLNLDNLSRTPDIDNVWLLPDGVSDLFSAEAEKQEWLRHQLTQLLIGRGYQLICPPMIEFTESLLGNASEDLKRHTFKIIDQLSGRLMGVRADITPQILRIDTHLTKLGKAMPVSRYCYAGHVIRTLPDGLFGSRTPLQLGAEIFGCNSLEADIELLDVLFDMLDTLDIKQHLHMDIGHVTLFARLIELAGLHDEEASILIGLYANKALPELKAVCETLPMGADFYQLAVYGNNVDILADKLSNTAKNDNIIINAMNDVNVIVRHITEVHKAKVSVDVTELGFHYHTGIVFNAYFDKETQAVVRGGRFSGNTNTGNNINNNTEINTKRDVITNVSSSNKASSNNTSGKAIATREATGFSLDVSRLQRYITIEPHKMVLVNFDDLQQVKNQQSKQLLLALDNKVKALRASKQRVVYPLHNNDRPHNATHELILEADNWTLQPL